MKDGALQCRENGLPGPSGSSFGGTRDVWSFHRFRVTFRDLAHSGALSSGGEEGNDVCRMVMCLDGDLRVCAAGAERRDAIPLAAGGCCLEYHPFNCRCLNCTHCSRAQVLELICPAVELMRLTAGTRLGRELGRAVDACRPLVIFQSITPGIHQTLNSLREALEESDQGFVPLVLAKSLEMIWWFSRAMDRESGHDVSPETRRAVEKAKSILDDNMADPPALASLAAAVGMSVSKFKQVFPRVCGMPPYAYLRQVRMDRARHLLLHGVSVTEAAFEVGYSNLSHFSKTFAALYGIRPSQL
jgi:AraC-like DNA-binding protein